MKYCFKDFVFDDESLMLFKQGEAIVFRSNEAKLLALFLSNPEKIYSKYVILDMVWAGKVVAEQAVFQNISNLRALFGEEAIKTFSKKGYQWQLTFDLTAESLAAHSENDVVVAQPVKGAKVKIALGISLTLLGVFLLAGFFYYQTVSQPVAQAIPRIAVLPLLIDSTNQHASGISKDVVESMWQVMLKQKNFHHASAPAADYDDFFYTPQKYFKAISERNKTNYVLVMSVGQRNDRYFIRYALKGAADFWTAELEAKTWLQLSENIIAHLKRVTEAKILDIDSDNLRLANAKLTLLYGQYPDDLIILQRLILSQLYINDPNNAILLTQELQTKASLAGDDLYYGLGYLYLAKALLQQELLVEAAEQLHKAADVFQRINNYHLLSETQSQFADIGLRNKNYEQVKKALQQAIVTARQAQDLLLEVRLNNWLSIVANKLQQHDDKLYFLQQAESLLDKSHQSIEHYALIYFYSAMYTEDKRTAEHLYRRILQILPAEQRWWEYDRAQAHLSELLIQQQRWQDAVDIFMQAETSDASQHLMLAKIYAAQKLWEKAESHGLSAFKESSLNGRPLALDAALFLLTTYSEQHKLDEQKRYRQFILNEAVVPPLWVRFNKSALEKVGVEFEEKTLISD
ncbi:MAG: winged helix-turn-helix domain-containing protein [Pseudomonadota bacterium]